MYLLKASSKHMCAEQNEYQVSYVRHEQEQKKQVK